MSEAGAGSDVVSMKLRAEKKGDRCVLNGTKFWITNAPRPTPWWSTPRPTRRGRARHHRLPDREGHVKGFTARQKLDKLGMRGSDTGELVFEDCEVPEENVLGASAAA